MSEYDKVQNFFEKMFCSCIGELYIDKAYDNQNKVLLDAASNYKEEILEIVAELEGERNDLKERLEKIEQLIP